MVRKWEKAKDLFHGALKGLADFFGDLVGEVLLGLTACGLLLLAWWGYQTAPYVTIPIVAGVLLFAGYGAVALMRGVRGRRLAGRLGVAAILAAVAVVGLLSYLPYCGCLG